MSRWLTRMVRNVPPARTVASSRRAALSSSASSSEVGASHSGSGLRARLLAVDQLERALVEGPRQLAGACHLDPLVHALVLCLRPLGPAAARPCTSQGRIRRSSRGRRSSPQPGEDRRPGRHPSRAGGSAARPRGRGRRRRLARAATRRRSWPSVRSAPCSSPRRAAASFPGSNCSPPGKWRSISWVSAASSSASDAAGSSSSNQSRARSRCLAFQ